MACGTIERDLRITSGQLPKTRVVIPNADFVRRVPWQDSVPIINDGETLLPLCRSISSVWKRPLSWHFVGHLLPSKASRAPLASICRDTKQSDRIAASLRRRWRTMPLTSRKSCSTRSLTPSNSSFMSSMTNSHSTGKRRFPWLKMNSSDFHRKRRPRIRRKFLPSGRPTPPWSSSS